MQCRNKAADRRRPPPEKNNPRRMRPGVGCDCGNYLSAGWRVSGESVQGHPALRPAAPAIGFDYRLVMMSPGGAFDSPLLAAVFFTSLTTYLSASEPIDFTKSSLVCASVAESKVTFWVVAVSPAAMTMLVTPSSLLNASRTCFLQPPHVTPVIVTVYTVLGAASAVLIPAKRASAVTAMMMAFMVCFIGLWYGCHSLQRQ